MKDSLCLAVDDQDVGEMLDYHLSDLEGKREPERRGRLDALV